MRKKDTLANILPCNETVLNVLPKINKGKCLQKIVFRINVDVLQTQPPFQHSN